MSLILQLRADDLEAVEAIRAATGAKPFKAANFDGGPELVQFLLDISDNVIDLIAAYFTYLAARETGRKVIKDGREVPVAEGDDKAAVARKIDKC